MPSSIQEIALSASPKRDTIKNGSHGYKPLPGDIVINGFSKTGTTWLQQIVHQIRTKGHEDFRNINDVSWYRPWTWIIWPWHTEQNDMWPRLLKAHDTYENLPKCKGQKYLFITRDPYDTAWSIMKSVDHFYRTDVTTPLPEDFYRQYYQSEMKQMSGSYGDVLNSWWSHRFDDDVLWVHFEDLKSSLSICLKRIADFLEFPFKDEAEFKRVHDLCTFEYMVQHHDKFQGDTPPGTPNPSPKSNRKLTHTAFLRRDGGQIGQGRNLPASIREQVDEEWTGVCSKTGFQDYNDLYESSSLLKQLQHMRYQPTEYGIKKAHEECSDSFSKRRYQPKNDDIIVNGFYKTGTTWLQQIVHQLRTKGHEGFENINDVSMFVPSGLEPWECEPDISDLLAKQMELRCLPRLLKAHDKFELLPKCSGQRFIFVTRDPHDAAWSTLKDIESSYVPDLHISLEEFYLAFYRNMSNRRSANYSQLVVSWWSHRNDDNVLWLHYEDLKLDLPKCLQTIATFLDMPFTSDDEFRKVYEMCTFEYMAEHKEKFKGDSVVVEELKGPGFKKNLRLATVRPEGGQIGQGRLLPKSLKERIDGEWAAEITERLGFPTYGELLKAGSLLKRLNIED